MSDEAEQSGARSDGRVGRRRRRWSEARKRRIVAESYQAGVSVSVVALSANITETPATPWNFCRAVEVKTDDRRERLDDIARDGRSGPGRTEERRDEAPRAGATDPEVWPSEEAQVRAVSDSGGAESCTQPGEVGRLLRREGLYSSHRGMAQGAA